MLQKDNSGDVVVLANQTKFNGLIKKEILLKLKTESPTKNTLEREKVKYSKFKELNNSELRNEYPILYETNILQALEELPEFDDSIKKIPSHELTKEIRKIKDDDKIESFLGEILNKNGLKYMIKIFYETHFIKEYWVKFEDELVMFITKEK